MSKLSIVIPVFNNTKTLVELHERLKANFSQFQIVYEIIFINDGSKDNSFEVLKKIASDNPRVKVISLSRNYGQHSAICAGFEVAQGNYIVLMDADLQDRPEDIILLLKDIQKKKCDVLYTIRVPNSKQQSSRLTSKLFHLIFSKIVKTFVPQNIGTFRIFNQKFLNAILQFKEKNIIYGPLMFYMGFKSDFIEIPYVNAINNHSNYSFKKRFSLACNSLISYTDIPLKFFLTLGFGFFSLSTIYLFIVVIQYYFKGASLPDGSTLIIILMSMGFGCLMICLGIIGIYIFKIYQSVLNRPRYLIQETINHMEEK